MIYNNIEYKVKLYRNSSDSESPVEEYIGNLDVKEKTKVYKYIEVLRMSNGVLDEPYSRHIKDKIRELRVDFSNKKHRIFYFTFINKNIILLHAFLKKTQKTPMREIKIAEENYVDAINNPKLYE
jgi:phage-related protein